MTLNNASGRDVLNAIQRSKEEGSRLWISEDGSTLVITTGGTVREAKEFLGVIGRGMSYTAA